MEKPRYCKLCKFPSKELQTLILVVGGYRFKIDSCPDCDTKTMENHLIIICLECGPLGTINKVELLKTYDEIKQVASIDSPEYTKINRAISEIENCEEHHRKRKIITLSSCPACYTLNSICQQSRLTIEDKKIILQ